MLNQRITCFSTIFKSCLTGTVVIEIVLTGDPLYQVSSHQGITKLCDKIVIKKRLFEAYKPVFIEILGIKMFGKHSFDLEKQFTFYASYHNNPINVLIHILCIWPILATGLVILQVRYYRVTSVSFSSCQRNLIQTFQIERMIEKIKKIDLIFS